MQYKHYFTFTHNWFKNGAHPKRGARDFFLSKLLILIFAFPTQKLRAQTTLVQGDIAFVAYNSDGSIDDFAFIILKDITAGTTITFTDHLWRFSTGGFDETYAGNCNTETFLTWTATVAMSTGSVVVISNPGLAGSTNPSQATASSGTVFVPGSCPDFTFPPTGDVLYAYQGTKPSNNSAVNWLACINMDGGWLSSASTSTSASAKPGGLNDANILLFTPEIDNVVYKGPLTGSVSALRTAIYTLSNWVGDDDNPYTLPQDIGSSTLPVIWGIFEVSSLGTFVELNWSTVQESNTDFFAIECASGTINFQEKGRVAAAGQSSHPLSYRFAMPVSELGATDRPYLFRIKQVDLDGRFTYSEVRSIEVKPQKKLIQQVTVNHSLKSIELQLTKTGVHIQVYDFQGRKLLEDSSGNKSIRLNLGLAAPSGFIIILLRNRTGETETLKITL